MMNKLALRIALTIALSVSAVTLTACQTTHKAEPEMLTGQNQVTHERHNTGFDSHTAD